MHNSNWPWYLGYYWSYGIPYPIPPTERPAYILRPEQVVRPLWA